MKCEKTRREGKKQRINVQQGEREGEKVRENNPQLPSSIDLIP